MNIKDEDLFRATKLTSQQIEHVTCAVCCKYYIAPETASCGHTLCHTCWRGRQRCAYCSKEVERSSLKHNGPLQNLTENVHALSDAFEKLFNIKVAEFLMGVESEDFTKNVRDWLTSSQNHFSEPARSTEYSMQELEHQNPLNVSSNKIQIHTNMSKSIAPNKVIYVPNVPQDDWDKIEPMPDSEDIGIGKENVIGPMDIEPFSINDDNEYTINNPRRSSRKRELKPDDKNKLNENELLDDPKDLCEENDIKSNKSKQHWMNVKKMKKEFSKLNKKNKGKLNVSIEMCKKTPSTTKTIDVLPPATSQYNIEENTPDDLHNKYVLKDNILQSRSEHSEKHVIETQSTNIDKYSSTNIENQSTTITDTNKKPDYDQNNSKENNSKSTNIQPINFSCSGATKKITSTKENIKLPFYKKSSLHPKFIGENFDDKAKEVNTTYHNVVLESNKITNDDIEITIKVANTIANIVIKRKNDMELKINTDREIQTSLDAHDINEKSNCPKTTSSQNIVINVSENHEIQVNHQGKTNPRVDKLKKNPACDKAGSDKKNTDSADTASLQFEITESVEKELSKVMDFEEVDKQIESKRTLTINNEKLSKDKSQNTVSQNTKSQKQRGHIDENEFLNDLDLFESESVKESDVQLLKNSDRAASEILLCTVRTKNKTQKSTAKRRKCTTDEDLLPNSKKPKICDESLLSNSKRGKVNYVVSESKQTQFESESMNYDAIMGTVFANIDADIEETRQSQNIIKSTYTLNNNNDLQKATSTTGPKNKGTQELASPINLDKSLSQKFNQKDSENLFSMGGENENVETVPLASANKKMPPNVPLSLEEFTTPVMSQADNNVHSDDSDKSVVEETPQKTSFTKIKQKSNGASKEVNQSQRIEEAPGKVHSNKKPDKTSVVNLTDTSESEVRSNMNETAIRKLPRQSTETPLTMNKFVDHIAINSTPLAKKSLNFDSEAIDDLTLCVTNDAVAKTTQEKEFMNKAFEKTPTTPVAKLHTLRSLALKHNKYVVAGSCLTAVENANVRKLCARNKWSFVDKYTKDLTHLVVGVDEENKAQRTVKYMCALASSKWIVSYEWVKKSLQSKELVYEEPYEALDNTGHPGPARARTATKKLFQGISFFCLPPFGDLGAANLKEMIESAGGRVVASERAARVEEDAAPALYLAEPENTQEDRFIYLAMQHSIVPVNYEWVLNCLGSYTLSSIQRLLLCPTSLLPRAIRNWPPELLAHDDDDDD